MLGSWERDVGRAEKQKRKKYFLFLFPEPKRFLSDGLFCKYTRTHTYFVFVLSAALRGRDIPTYSVKNAVFDWAKTFHRKVFLCKQELIFSDGNWYKNNFILVSFGEASTVLRKSKWFPLEQLVSFQETRPTLLLSVLLLHRATLCVILLCAVDSQ
jgi:hypothetical protein